MDAAEAFKLIKQQVSVPLVVDIHFDYRIVLKVAEYGVDCCVLTQVILVVKKEFAKLLIAHAITIFLFVLVNGGSLEKDIQEKYGEPTPEALVESAMRHVDILDRPNFSTNSKSVKASDVFLAVGSTVY